MRYKFDSDRSIGLKCCDGVRKKPPQRETWPCDELSATCLIQTLFFVSPPQGEGALGPGHHRDGRKQDDHYQLKSKKYRGILPPAAAERSHNKKRIVKREPHQHLYHIHDSSLKQQTRRFCPERCLSRALQIPDGVTGDSVRERTKTFTYDFSYDSGDRSSTRFVSQEKVI